MAAATLALGVIRIVTVARAQIPASYDLAYEGPQVATIQAIQRGENLYSHTTYNGGRFVFTMYTPLYHLLVALLPAGPTPFFTGRVVSLTAMLAAPLLLFLVARPVSPAATAAGLFMLLFPACMNAAFTKNDSLALVLGVGAVAVMARGSSDSSAVLAAILVLASFAAKQSFIAPGLACGIAAAFTSRRHLKVFTVGMVISSALLGGAASLAFGRDLWWCIAVAVSNPWEMERLIGVLAAAMGQPAAVAVLACCGWGVLTIVRDGIDRRELAWPAYAAASTAVLLATAGKEGSSTNYVLEPAIAWLGLFVQRSSGPVHLIPTLKQAAHGRSALPPLVFALVAAVADVATADRSQYDLSKAAVNVGAEENRWTREVGLLRLGGANPRILNLGWGSLTAELPGEVCLSDPLLQMLAFDARAVPVGPLLDDIVARRFDLVVMYPNLVADFMPRQAAAAEVFSAVAMHYRSIGQVADVFVWVPR